MGSLLRTGATRSLLRNLNTTTSQPRTQLHTLSRSSRPQVLTPKTLALTRWQSAGSSGGREPVDTINTKREEKLMDRKLKPTPDSVSTSSTTLPVTGIENPRSGHAAEEEQDPKMMAGISSDLVCLHIYARIADAWVVSVGQEKGLAR